MQTQLSLYWLNELINLRGYNLDFFIKNLTINGFEVEDCIAVSYNSNVTIALQLSITANRGDAMCLRGIAREFRIFMTRYKSYKAKPPVFKVFGVRKAIRRRRRFRRAIPYWGGSRFYLRKRLHSNRYTRRISKRLTSWRNKTSQRWLLKQTIFKFIWAIENTIYRSPRWKPNRLYFKQPIFNNNDPKIFSRFLCFKLENLKNLNSPGWLQKRLAYSGIIPQNDLSDYKNYVLLESGYPFELYDLKKIIKKCNSNKFKLQLGSVTDRTFVATNDRNYTINENNLILKANDQILSVAGIISNKEFAYTKETDSILIEGAIFNPKMISRQSRLLEVKTIRSNYYARGGMNGNFFLHTWYRLLALLKAANPQRKFKLHTSANTSENESQIYHVPCVTWYAWNEARIFESWDFWLREKKIAEVLGPVYHYMPIIYKNLYRVKNRLPAKKIEKYLRKLNITYEFKYLPGEGQYFPITYGRIPIPPRSSKRPLPLKARGWMPPRTYGKPGRYWLLRIPNYRKNDLKTERDMIEEFIRIYGVDKIISISPETHSHGTADLSYKIRKELTPLLLNEGFNELISYSLTNEIIENNIQIELVNPLAKEYSKLRLSLLPSLVQIVSENIRQGNRTFEGFEYGHIFSQDSTGQYSEIECVSGIFGGVELRPSWSEKVSDLSWFEAKGKIEKIFEKLNLPIIWYEWKNNLKIENKYFSVLHPYRTAMLYLQSPKIFLGVFGELNPILAKQYNIFSKFYLFEFNFKVLVSHFTTLNLSKQVTYKDYSTYPKLVKDLSFIITKDISLGSILEFINLSKFIFLNSINLLDIYEGESLSSNQVSVCIQLVFQARNKTLTNVDIEPWLKWIYYKLEKKYGAIFR